MKRALVLLALTLALPGAAGCSSEPPTTTVTVFAAASLKGPFTKIGQEFQAAHPGTTVQFSFAGSSDLVAQLQQGAPADVLATADAATMQAAARDGLIAPVAMQFATNSMAIAVPPGNPAGIRSFADLADDRVQVVVCAPQVPCGAATQRIQRKTGVALRPVSEEQAVTGVLEKVAAGEAEAGVVYVTDVQGAAGRVEAVAIPKRDNAENAYFVAALQGSAQSIEAGRFQSFVMGPRGQRVLDDAGFGPG